jgi:hypothetical protein
LWGAFIWINAADKETHIQAVTKIDSDGRFIINLMGSLFADLRKVGYFTEYRQVGYYQEDRFKKIKFYTLSPYFDLKEYLDRHPQQVESLIPSTPNVTMKWDTNKSIKIAIVGRDNVVNETLKSLQEAIKRIEHDTPLKFNLVILEEEDRRLDERELLKKSDILYVLNYHSNAMIFMQSPPESMEIFPVVRTNGGHVVLNKQNQIQKAVCEITYRNNDSKVEYVNNGSVENCLYSSLGLVNLEEKISAKDKDALLQILYNKLQAGMTKDEVGKDMSAAIRPLAKDRALISAFNKSINNYQLHFTTLDPILNGKEFVVTDQKFDSTKPTHLKFLAEEKIPNPNTVLKWQRKDIHIWIDDRQVSLDSSKQSITRPIIQKSLEEIRDKLARDLGLKLTWEFYTNKSQMPKTQHQIGIHLSGWTRENPGMRYMRLNLEQAKDFKTKYYFEFTTLLNQMGNYGVDLDGNIVSAYCDSRVYDEKELPLLIKSCLVAALGLPDVEQENWDDLLKLLYSDAIAGISDKNQALEKISTIP